LNLQNYCDDILNARGEFEITHEKLKILIKKCEIQKSRNSNSRNKIKRSAGSFPPALAHCRPPRSAACTPNFWKSYTEPPILPGQMYKVRVLPKLAKKTRPGAVAAQGLTGFTNYAKNERPKNYLNKPPQGIKYIIFGHILYIRWSKMAYLDNHSPPYSQLQNDAVTKCSNFNIPTGCKNPGDIDFVRKLSKTAKENTNQYNYPANLQHPHNFTAAAQLFRPYRACFAAFLSPQVILSVIER